MYIYSGNQVLIASEYFPVKSDGPQVLRVGVAIHIHLDVSGKERKRERGRYYPARPTLAWRRQKDT